MLTLGIEKKMYVSDGRRRRFQTRDLALTLASSDRSPAAFRIESGTPPEAKVP